MPYGIYEASERAKKQIDPNIDPENTAPAVVAKKSKYSLELLKVGQAVAVPFDDVKENSLRVYAANQGTKLKRKFSVLIHAEAKVYEVARIA